VVRRGGLRLDIPPVSIDNYANHIPGVDRGKYAGGGRQRREGKVETPALKNPAEVPSRAPRVNSRDTSPRRRRSDNGAANRLKKLLD
jgi:hypothetical protein